MSGTYNSRLFNFINSQSHKLKDGCARGWRHFQVAVVWTGQILLYPFYRLKETTKIFTAKSVAQPQPRIAPPQPPADITIERVLELVAKEGYAIAPVAPRNDIPADDWSFIDEDLWNTALAPRSIKEREISYTPNFQPTPTIPRKLIRGLGSLLANRNLVLVTTENEILDILSRQQQQKLQMRVSRELATKLLQGDNHPTAILPPSPSSPAIDTPRPKIAASALPALPQPQNAPSWWQKLIDRPISPNLGFVPTAPKIARTEAISAPLPPQPQILNPTIASTPFSNLDLAQITDRQPPSATIRDRLQELWQYYREFIKVDLPDETVATSLTLTPDRVIELTHPGNSTQRNTLDRASDFPIQKNTKGALNFWRKANLPTDIEGLNHRDRDVDLEYQPDWIETQVQDLGYARSPLAKLLSWLDRIMLNLENWTLKIWHAIVK
jgi:hypothetical protein